MFVVLEPSGFCSVVSVKVSLIFPAASLYTSFQGLFGVVMVQCCFQDFVFSFLMVYSVMVYIVVVCIVVVYSVVGCSVVVYSVLV